ncbi:MAG: hypothetical protein VX899_11150 [Myxococcota bacterium]|nr:hypothetical protein [Myxococcota bacterium]
MTALLLTLVACGPKNGPNAAGQTLPEVAPEDYPSFEQLMAAHEAAVGDGAMGGTWYMKQSILAPKQGLGGQVELWVDGEQVYTRAVIDGMGETLQGYDGEIAWEIDPNQGPKILEGEEAGPLRFLAYSTAPLGEQYPQAQVVGVRWFPDADSGEAAWAVEAVPATYSEPTTLYFAVDDGVMLGSRGKVPTTMGKLRQTSVLSDWEEIGGVSMPRVMETTMLSLTMVATTLEFQPDPQDMPDFAPPASVQALLEPAE